jgi:RNA polymerase sigma-70 factor (ECF subfamily)
MDDARAGFERLLGELRPKLHRYCARMVGSVIDGEDILQEAMAKAIEAFPRVEPLSNPEGWLFRIIHNTALDFLRARARRGDLGLDRDLDAVADPSSALDGRQAAAASLQTLMRLPVAQRSSVILMDVLGYSLDEICAVLDVTLPSVKAALHRGRARLRELAHEPDDAPPPKLTPADRARLATYVSRFNERDFDSLRDLLAEDVRLELVNRVRMNGREEVGRYFGNYSKTVGWRFAPGLVEGRPAALVQQADEDTGRPLYFVLLDWSGEQLGAIRDFRYARYAMDGAKVEIAV